MTAITITDVNAVLGIIFGLSALVISILNYLRDMPKVDISLSWNMRILNDPQRDPNKYYGVVSVKNAGRRPVYLSHICIDLPKKYISKHGHFLLTEGVTGKTYNEGDPPKQFTVDQDLYLAKISDVTASDPRVLKKLRATVSAGNNVFRSHYAKEPPKTQS